MKILIHCRNSKCKYYYEDGCWFDNGMVVIGENGKCECFKAGEHEFYRIKKEFYEHVEKIKIEDDKND